MYAQTGLILVLLSALSEFDKAAFVIIAGVICYILPGLIAVFRGHPNSTPIVVIIILLGWTGIGWIVALVWSLTAIDSTRRYR